MKVKAKKKHFNGYGAKYEKKSGDIYDVPEAAAKTLIASGQVVEVKPSAPAKPSSKKPAAKKSVEKAPEGDGAK